MNIASSKKHFLKSVRNAILTRYSGKIVYGTGFKNGKVGYSLPPLPERIKITVRILTVRPDILSKRRCIHHRSSVTVSTETGYYPVFHR
ncbi:MAG: hypothetical protein RSE37_19270, partial [Citrobacter sp.]